MNFFTHFLRPARRGLASLAAALVPSVAILVATFAGSHAHAAELRVGVSADITSIDPHYVNITPTNNIAFHIFGTLVAVDNDARLTPGLATEWKAIDATTWEFKLRKGVKFSDGSDFTAEDVVFSIDRIPTIKNSPGPYTSFVSRITAKEIVDAHTVRFKTATPYAMVPYDMVSVYIVSKKAATNATTDDFNSGKAAIGAGPYKLASYKRGDRVELVRNDRFWGPKPTFDKATFRILTEDKARIAALLSGDVDAIENIPTADVAKLKSNAKFKIEQKVSWRTIFFHMEQSKDAAPGITAKDGKPLGKNPLKDARVRLAISKAISRPAIIDRLMENMAIPASNVVSPPIFGHVASLKPELYDPDGARKLLAEAGYPDGFTMTIHAPNNRYVNDEQIAQAVAQMLARVGIATKVEAMPVAVYFGKARAGEFSFAMLGWGSQAGDLAVRSLLTTPNAQKGMGAWNWGKYSNPKVDSIIDEAFGVADPAKREVMALEAAKLVLADTPVIPIHHQIVSWAMRKDLSYAARTDEYTFAHQFKGK